MDLDRRPDLAARFGVSVTPTTMVIRRGSAQRMVIATGVEAYHYSCVLERVLNQWVTMTRRSW